MSHPAIARNYKLFVVAFVAVSIAFVVNLFFDFTALILVATFIALGFNVVIIYLLLRGVVDAQREPGPEARPLPDHLRMSRTDRGFGHFPTLLGEYGDEVTVSESSNAGYAGVWLRSSDIATGEIAVNLTAQEAWRLAEQLAFVVANHYQGDQRPGPDRTALSFDLDRFEAVEEARP